ncbi:hypothetical protein MUY21_02720 [Aliiroseovarius sp. S2029]|uniref:calcium-binding protein n=1 Tax=Aliiroseovarius sp. S2029 TaxID=2936988 RepID=UPI0020BE1B66|nr:hypothetical protein [Aliiroseovarius sp. S2029]MCK8482939.1 hypothetical protein [Aliiroseovarius sp. S2029]
MALIFKSSRNDIVRGTDSSDWIFTFGGDDEVHARAGNDFVFGGRGNDWISGGDGGDYIYGQRGDDFLIGGAGADVLRGGRGNDTAVFVAADNARNAYHNDAYYGGKGHDTLRLEFTADEWAECSVKEDVAGFLNWLSDTSAARSFTFTSLGLTARSFECLKVFVDGVEIDPTAPPDVTEIDLSDSTEDETVTISDDTDTNIQTGSGDDTITAGNGTNVIDAGDGNNVVTTGSGDDDITTGSGDDTVTIGDGDDIVRTGAGNDTIIAGAGLGDDIIDGGLGNDTVAYPSVTNGVTIDLRAEDRSGTMTINNGTIGDYLSSKGYSVTTPVGIATGDVSPTGQDEVEVDILISIENATGGKGSDHITGNDDDNVLRGGDESDTGNDTLLGLAGNDLLIGGAGNDTIDGGAGDDTIEGGAGNDTIDGGEGFNQIVLSGTNDDYDVISNGDGTYKVTDVGGTGDGVDVITNIEDLVFSNTTLALWTFVDGFDIFGTPNSETIFGTQGRDNIYGDAGDDQIFGRGEEDWITGGAGNDLIDGGDGVVDDDSGWDAADYMEETFEGGSQGVTVNLGTQTATDTFGDTDTLVNIERINATNFADNLIGSDDDDAFDPHGGDDEIHGGDGWDNLMYQLSAGEGGTSGIVATFSPTVEGSGTVKDPFGDTDTFTGIEALRGTEFDDDVTGGFGFQFIRTFAGDDIVDGTIGQQMLGYHDDANYGGFEGISVDMSVVDGNGFATVTDGFGDQDLIKDIEEIRGTGTDDSITGSSADNFFLGEAGDDLIDGQAGSDTIQGGLGNDTILGGVGDDNLDGGADNDTITGGAGVDVMIGGAGADQFIFSLGDGNDIIEDFTVGEDLLVLEGGVTITGLSELDVGGDASLDTVVELSSGEEIALLDVSGLTDWNALL